MPAIWTADEFLRSVEDALRPLILNAGGVLDVATDPDHAIEILSNSPGKWRAILGWPGYGGHPDAILGMGGHQLYLIIQVAKGLPVRAGDVLHRRGPQSVPLMALVDQASRWIRSMRFLQGAGLDPKGFAQTGSAWLEIEGLETKQHQLDFSIAAALPAHTEEIPVTLSSL